MKRNGKGNLSVILSALMALSVIFTGCMSAEQRDEMEKNLEQAKSNASKYIEEKYGIEADVTEAEIDGSSGLFGFEPNSYAYVSMRYDGWEFTVYIDGASENTDGKDDYQAEDIRVAWTDELDKITGGKASFSDVSNVYITKKECYKCLYNTYFDGGNWEELAEENAFDAFVLYDDGTDLKVLEGGEFPAYGKTSAYTFISYSTPEPLVVTYNDNSFVKKNAMCIDNACVKSSSDKFTYTKINLGDEGDFYYLSDNQVAFSKIEPDDASSWDGHGASGARIVSNAYSMDAPEGEVWVYFPKDNMTDSDVSGVRFATASGSGDDKDFFASPLTYDMGYYYAAKLDTEGQEFYFVLIGE